MESLRRSEAPSLGFGLRDLKGAQTPGLRRGAIGGAALAAPRAPAMASAPDDGGPAASRARNIA